MPPHIYLASRSPRRAELLQQMGIRFSVLPSDIDESQLPDELPAAYVMRLARSKAEVCRDSLDSGEQPFLPVLAADTTVSVDGVILGKPVDADEARSMLRQMSGRWHEVLTGLAVATQGTVEALLNVTRVQMAELTPAEIEAYIASGEPFDKAGAYGIQGLAGTFIKRIEGSYSGVMGLPIFETAQLLKSAGIRIL
ncbi:MAG TPA: Maf family protein [Methylophilaceae bacterium]|nr:Maf family protein [Methylophilaceae bacterium]